MLGVDVGGIARRENTGQRRAIVGVDLDAPVGFEFDQVGEKIGIGLQPQFDEDHIRGQFALIAVLLHDQAARILIAVDLHRRVTFQDQHVGQCP